MRGDAVRSLNFRETGLWVLESGIRKQRKMAVFV